MLQQTSRVVLRFFFSTLIILLTVCGGKISFSCLPAIFCSDLLMLEMRHWHILLSFPLGLFLRQILGIAKKEYNSHWGEKYTVSSCYSYRFHAEFAHFPIKDHVFLCIYFLWFCHFYSLTCQIIKNSSI